MHCVTRLSLSSCLPILLRERCWLVHVQKKTLKQWRLTHACVQGLLVTHSAR